MRTGLLCVLLGWCLPVIAAASSTPSIQDMAAMPRWQALLHINPGATLRDRHKSYVDDKHFFFADNGASDPQAELQASIKALKPADSPARCRFPARYRFIAGQLGWQDPAPFAQCPDYLQWRQAVHAKRAVLVFPASYLNSPSSMFGHTLLRLDQGDDDAVWLSWAVNFGAVTTGKDNSLLYIYRGLAGGYPGRFNLVPYVKKIQEYSHMENRDMWEYTLDLTPQQIDWMIDHLWELKDINFDYYFFDENCSFRLLELVEVARPGADLLDGLRLAEVPVNTVRTLDQKGFVTARHYRPSKAVEMDVLRRRLSRDQQALARRLADDPSLANGDAFTSASQGEQAIMAELAYRYLRLIHRKEARTEEVAGRSFALLTLMNKLPATEPPVPAHVEAPEKGHGTQMRAVAGGQHESDDFGELTYRFTYHDLLDNAYGFLRGAQIEGLGMTLRSTESGAAKLQDLDVVSIRSLAPRDRFIKPISWDVKGGIERAWAGRYRLARYVQGGAGASWRLGALQPYLLGSLRVENNSEFSSFVTPGAGVESGILYHRGAWQGQLGTIGHYFTNGEYRYTSQLAVQWALTRQQGLRAVFERDDWQGGGEDEFKLQWRWYID
ncbi:hypothetical protein A11A3_01515 [Alcanivorax hongdengensis A-11-3]|uniref:Uncharacterized protein n=1 Tax=Alcanivorax hongdengensis A-11-3 TaxID=1177179 RepID=L0WGI0_9GAMM|nr:DUF4105 domain-containing protein [Alcanivorax hongdengensis]EKF76131.1 hypothetical protein A11A3_01515 [Alcanivorax hongdengensis A-11-3]